MNIASTTAEVADAARLSPETVLRMRRMAHGPFQQHRDWQFIGTGTRQLRWDKEQALQSLWNYKRQPSSDVKTFSQNAAPLC